MSESKSKQIILSWCGTVHVGADRHGKHIGKWTDRWRGEAQFKGKMNGGEWSPWMRKRELRDWFANQIAADART